MTARKAAGATKKAAQRRTVASVQAELDAYKDKVRKAAVQITEQRGACSEGLNEFLASVDLQPEKTAWTGTVTITLVIDEFLHGDDYWDANSALTQTIENALDSDTLCGYIIDEIDADLSNRA